MFTRVPSSPLRCGEQFCGIVRSLGGCRANAIFTFAQPGARRETGVVFGTSGTDGERLNGHGTWKTVAVATSPYILLLSARLLSCNAGSSPRKIHLGTLFALEVQQRYFVPKTHAPVIGACRGRVKLEPHPPTRWAKPDPGARSRSSSFHGLLIANTL